MRIVTGSEDPLASEIVAQLAARPNVELVTVAGAGHHPQLTHGDALMELLRRPVREGAAASR